MSVVAPRILDRIRRLVDDRDYRSAEDALADVHRVAVLAGVDGAAAEREAVRRDAVRRANEARSPGWTAPREGGTVERVLFVIAIVLGCLAVALVAISPRSGTSAFSLQEGTIVAGVVALAAAGLFVFLEPFRARGELVGRHAPPAIYLFFTVIWWAFAASVLLLRWSEVAPSGRVLVIVGLVLFAAAGAVLLLLWRRAVASDRAGGTARVLDPLRGLLDRADGDAVYAALDGWWVRTGPAAATGEDFARTSAAVLSRLRESGLIAEKDEVRARVAVGGAWTERR